MTGVEHVIAHIGRVPGIYEILPVEAGGQGPRVAVKLAVLFDGGQKDPGHRDEDAHRQGDEDHIDKDLIEPVAGPVFFTS